jgi:flagellar biosynthesis regulator FlbT
VGRSFDYLQPNNHPVFDQQIYFQIALKTLGNVGTDDPTSMLTQDIPGYVDKFGAINSF